VIQIITGATGTISKSFRQYLSNIPGKQEIKELQNTATLGTAHILTKVKVQNTFKMYNNIAYSKNSKHTTAATLYTPKAWIVSGMSF
jgi:hypothetical protein